MVMRINLRQIEAFRAVMLTGQMTAAAELLAVTQPAVSRLVRDFEIACNLRLFERRGNHIVPTQEAITLMKEVARSFVGVGRIATMAEEIGRHAAGTIRISAMPALANGILPRFLAKFLADKPDVHATLNGVSSPKVIEAVASGQADIGFAEVPLDRPGFLTATRPTPAVVAMQHSHPLASKAVIAPSDLAGQRMVSLDPGSIFSMRIEVALAGVPKISTIQAGLSHTALSLVSEGLGLLVIDPVTANEFVDRGVITRPFGVFIDAGFVAIRPASHMQSSMIQRFWDEFWAYYDGLSEDSAAASPDLGLPTQGRRATHPCV